MEVGEH